MGMSILVVVSSVASVSVYFMRLCKLYYVTLYEFCTVDISLFSLSESSIIYHSTILFYCI